MCKYNMYILTNGQEYRMLNGPLVVVARIVSKV